MKCPECKTRLKKVEVSVHDAKRKAISHQCPKCDYFEFEPLSSKRIIADLHNAPLKEKVK